MTSISDNALDFPYPYLIVTDNKNMCKTWQTALEDSEFKNMYDDFTDEAKETINDNLTSRICLKVDNADVAKCYTTNNKFETCGEFKKELPNSLRAEMAQIKTQLQRTKQQNLDEMLTYVNDKRAKLTTLIEINTSKQEMVNMNQGYNDLADDSIEEKKEKKSLLTDSIEEVDNLNNYASQNMSNKRKQLTSYQKRNSWVETFMWWFLLILLIVITLYFMSLPLTKTS
jgi:ATP-dependent Zn protease